MMALQKTEKARTELKPGTRNLAQRERSLLLLADGSKSVQDFRALFNGEGEQIVLRLLRDGYLIDTSASGVASANAAKSSVQRADFINSLPWNDSRSSDFGLSQPWGSSKPANSGFSSSQPLTDSRFNSKPASGPNSIINSAKEATTAEQRKNFPSPETTQSIRSSSDQFEGKRSLATTRMFLFDLCERMFARLDPQRAEFHREALRNAKDRESMLAASRVMITDVEQLAGADRADSISERIAMLLPPEQ